MSVSRESESNFVAIDMNFVIYEMEKRGLWCCEKLVRLLWKRFSEDQCATWMMADTQEDVDRFIVWLESGLNREEAFS